MGNCMWYISGQTCAFIFYFILMIGSTGLCLFVFGVCRIWVDVYLLEPSKRPEVPPLRRHHRHRHHHPRHHHRVTYPGRSGLHALFTSSLSSTCNFFRVRQTLLGPLSSSDSGNSWAFALSQHQLILVWYDSSTRTYMSHPLRLDCSLTLMVRLSTSPHPWLPQC